MSHTKSDSDETSLGVSSPGSPKRPASYFVQSPSRDSHDGDNKSLPTTAAATPGYSPTDSPSHNSSTFASSASRFSGRGFRWSRKRNEKEEWTKSHVIDEDEEEGYYYDDGMERKTWMWLNAGLVVVLIFLLMCLILWGASRNHSPQITVQGLTVHNFDLGQGGDFTGVPTMLLTINCSVRMIIHNPATFFGIHITSSPVDLFFSRIAVATGQLKKYYQPRKSKRVVSVNVEGDKAPIYGAWVDTVGSGISKSKVPVRLEFDVHTRGNVVGTLVETRHHRHISCFFLIDTSGGGGGSGGGGTKPIKAKNDSCTTISK